MIQLMNSIIHIIEPRYYIYLMDVAENVIFITSNYIDSKLLMIAFSECDAY